MKIIITRGLPASGKTTWAKQFIADNPSWVRINKDDLRKELLPGGWSQKLENSVIVPARNARIEQALANGMSVIVDDTNFGSKHEAVIRQLAFQKGANFEIRVFDTPVEECLERNSKRVGDERVPSDVIRRMAKDHLGWQEPVVIPAPYSHQEGLPWAIICDLDGTIALHDGVRNVYDGSKCHLDNVNWPVATVLRAMANQTRKPDPIGPTWEDWMDGGCEGERPKEELRDYQIIYLSGRDEKWRLQTQNFINGNCLPYDCHLYMRPEDDRRRDSIVKAELFDQYVRGKFNIRFVLDDRDQVVELWRSMGLACFQVAPGNF